MIKLDRQKNEIQKKFITKIKRKNRGKNKYLYLDKDKLEKLEEEIQKGGLHKIIKEYRKYNPRDDDITPTQEYNKYIDELVYELLYEDYKKDKELTYKAVDKYYNEKEAITIKKCLVKDCNYDLTEKNRQEEED